MAGSVRAAVLAARQARQLREKRSLSAGNGREQLRGPSVVASPPTQAFYRTKRLDLHLSLEKLEKPVLPMMLGIPETAPQSAPAARKKSVLFAESSFSDRGQSEPEPRAFRPRRASSVTLSMRSPEAAEFQEVAHDGPEELGKRTKRVKKLGKGAGGTVFLALYLPVLKLVAVKEVVVYQEEERHMVKRELHALHENLAPIDVDTGAFPAAGESSGPCPYLVAFYGAYLKPTKCAVSVVMEFMDMGSVQDLLDAAVTVSESVLRHAAFCCITALDHMHSQRMIHRDIKPANILMNRRGDFKVADFGLAGTLAKSKSFFSTFNGTMMYMAPERISGTQYTCVSDVWSLGIVLFSLATGAYPFSVDDGFFGLEEAICQDALPPMPNRFSSSCRDFIKRMLSREPTERLTSAEGLIHPFLRGYEGSTAFASFPEVWRSLRLKRAIDGDDASVIATLAVDYSRRYPGVVSLPSELVSPQSSRMEVLQAPQPKNSLFHRFTALLGQAPHPSREASTSATLSRLADDCDVSPTQLHNLFKEVHTTPQSLALTVETDWKRLVLPC
ncbi:hypothetical protein BBJ28_00004280 [Nothophytophthora sp. Chile5]|nr:hypothetical protein BBJ28_00004280 [Nothophytophthora sp. Chile5]